MKLFLLSRKRKNKKPFLNGNGFCNIKHSLPYYSTVMKSFTKGEHLSLTESSYSLYMSVQLSSANLWTAPYTPYQQELFDIICKFHDKEGWNFKQVSDWLVKEGYRTPRDKTFTHTHCWSIYTKKKRSIERFSREFETSITDISIKELG